MNEPVVSIITVVYNGVATLEAALQSALRQTYQHIDFVIVDGGSTDGTLVLAERYKDNFGSFASEPDMGIYDAMNKGIRMAKGEWLYFLGSDDLLDDNEVLTSFFSDQANLDYDLLYGNVTSPSYKGPYDGPFTLGKLLSRNISHQAIFYKKTVFDKMGNYNLRYRKHADWDMNIRCFEDPLIRTKYIARTVARFGADGASAGHDLEFLRERLIPAKLQYLNRFRLPNLRRIGHYDEWWRCLRNARIRAVADLTEYTGHEKIPASIRRMVKWQRLMPAVLLGSGIVSKGWMLLGYLRERIILVSDEKKSS